MDTEGKKKLASRIIITSSVLLSSPASWFFTMVGSSTGELGMRPITNWPRFIWTIWGIAWGAVCGYFIGHFLIKILLKRRNAAYGLLYGLLGGLTIGLVNGLLTETARCGVIIGVVLGSVPGLILAWIFFKDVQTRITKKEVDDG